MLTVNSAWNLVNFRMGLIRQLQASGFMVVLVAPYDKYVPQLTEIGCKFIDIDIDNKGMHPGRDLLLFLRFLRIFRQERPNILLTFTVKPNIYGSLAAQFTGTPVINNIAGLGTVFIRGGWLERFVRQLYKISLIRSKRVFFQNKDDLELFLSLNLVKSVLVGLVPGSGIDLMKFQSCPPPKIAPIRFLLIARILWDKGIGEFVEAARRLKAKGFEAEFCLLGFLDAQNLTAISREQVTQWTEEGTLIYLGVTDNVAEQIAMADCVVLPSYREGVPRSLLEAAAMARPIIATDVVGCRDAVDNGFNGYLCKQRDSADLADKMELILNLSSGEREKLGLNGREKVAREFDENIVINKYLNEINEILKC